MGVIDIAGQFRLAGTWGGQVPSSCPKKAQPWAQTRLLRASPSWDVKHPRMETAQLPWAPAPPLGCPHGEKVSPNLQPEPPIFQLVLLPLNIPPHAAVKSPAASPPSRPLLLVLGMPLGAPKAASSPSCTKPWSHSLSSQDKGSGSTVSEVSPETQSCLSVSFQYHRAQNKMLLDGNGSGNRR